MPTLTLIAKMAAVAPNSIASIGVLSWFHGQTQGAMNLNGKKNYITNLSLKFGISSIMDTGNKLKQ